MTRTIRPDAFNVIVGTTHPNFPDLVYMDMVVGESGEEFGYHGSFSGYVPRDVVPLLEAAPDLLAACKAQREAIDTLFAMLITLTKDHEPHCFFPSKSGQPWEALVQGNAAVAKATAVCA